ncbi:MAG: hypothetical protein JJU11_08830, partial [Candidatus Sumerlaeia bacterium]|nr:hypothetical protein [Candidatus Sumerlaeia bacterium]
MKKRLPTNHLLAAFTILRIILFLMRQITYFIFRSIGRDRVTSEQNASRQGLTFGRNALKTLGIKLTTSGPQPPTPPPIAPPPHGFCGCLGNVGEAGGF